MDISSLPGSNPLNFESKALENRLRQLKEATSRETVDENLRKVSKELEAIFIKQLLDTMQQTVPKDGLLGNSPGMDTWRDMFNEKLAQKICQQTPIGLAGMIYKELAKDLDQHREVPPAEADTKPEKMDTAPLNKGGVHQKVGESSSGGEKDSQGSGSISSFNDLIQKCASRYGLDPTLVAAVVIQESGDDPYAVSKAGAKGLMQLMPHTADSLGVENVFDPEQNIEGGTRYLRELLDGFQGDERLALAAYNAGPTAVRRYNGVPPYPETQGYVKKVIALKNRLKTF